MSLGPPLPGRAARRIAPGLGAAAAALVLPACGPRNFENENDRLRRLTLQQEGAIRALEARAAELEAKLGEANRAREAALDPDVLEAIPRCAGIDIDGVSGLQWSREGETGGPRVVAYVEPFDGRNRFVQIVGTLTVDAILAGPTGDPAPVTATITLGPAQVRDAYRTSITVYYYHVEIPIDAAAVPTEGTVTIRARFDDALSGLTHHAERTMRLRPAPAR